MSSRREEFRISAVLTPTRRYSLCCWTPAGSAEVRAVCVPLRLLVGEREFWIVELLPRVITTRMSRLRRLVLSDRWFFITCRVLPRRRHLSDSAFATLAQVIAERRAEHRFLLTAWVFLPDHWHAIFYPRQPLTISRVMEAIKDGATRRINHSRSETGRLRQAKKSRRGTQKARTSALRFSMVT